jgi:D-apionolactonase
VLAGDTWAARLEGAAETAESLGCALEIAVFAQSARQLDELLERLPSLPVSRLLVFAYEQEMSDPAMTRHAREGIARRGAGFPVIGGTDLWFAELNRARPDLTAMDGLVYTITPQVHTFDEESIAQSLEAQPDTVRTAATFAGGLPIVVSPVTLRPRDVVHVDHFNPVAAGGEMPFSVDPRQSSLFAAAWTVGSIAALGGAGAASLTYYETVGWRGIVPGDRPPPAAYVGAPPEGAFAVFHVFADVLETGGETMLVQSRSARPTEVCALALSWGERLRVFVANLTPREAGVELQGLPTATASVRMLDEHTANQALSDPLAYRSRAGEALRIDGGRASLHLAPFAVASVDAPAAR